MSQKNEESEELKKTFCDIYKSWYGTDSEDALLEEYRKKYLKYLFSVSSKDDIDCCIPINEKNIDDFLEALPNEDNSKFCSLFSWIATNLPKGKMKNIRNQEKFKEFSSTYWSYRLLSTEENTDSCVPITTCDFDKLLNSIKNHKEFNLSSLYELNLSKKQKKALLAFLVNLAQKPDQDPPQISLLNIVNIVDQYKFLCPKDVKWLLRKVNSNPIEDQGNLTELLNKMNSNDANTKKKHSILKRKAETFNKIALFETYSWKIAASVACVCVGIAVLLFTTLSHNNEVATANSDITTPPVPPAVDSIFISMPIGESEYDTSLAFESSPIMVLFANRYLDTLTQRYLDSSSIHISVKFADSMTQQIDTQFTIKHFDKVGYLYPLWNYDDSIRATRKSIENAFQDDSIILLTGKANPKTIVLKQKNTLLQQLYLNDCPFLKDTVSMVIFKEDTIRISNADFKNRNKGRMRTLERTEYYLWVITQLDSIQNLMNSNLNIY